MLKQFAVDLMDPATLRPAAQKIAARTRQLPQFACDAMHIDR